jgi:hypothetical protein
MDHAEADLLDGIGNVGVGEHQVLEGPSKAPEVSRSATGGLDSVETLPCVSTGDESGLQSIMLAHSRMSRAN